jgi:hypothetical protein
VKNKLQTMNKDYILSASVLFSTIIFAGAWVYHSGAILPVIWGDITSSYARI